MLVFTVKFLLVASVSDILSQGIILLLYFYY